MKPGAVRDNYLGPYCSNTPDILNALCVIEIILLPMQFGHSSDSFGPDVLLHSIHWVIISLNSICLITFVYVKVLLTHVFVLSSKLKHLHLVAAFLVAGQHVNIDFHCR